MERIGVDQDVVLTFAFNPELLQILFTNILSSFLQDLNQATSMLYANFKLICTKLVERTDAATHLAMRILKRAGQSLVPSPDDSDIY